MGTNREEKKSFFWKSVMMISTVLILVIAAFFVFRLFTENPLKGRWVCENKKFALMIEDDRTALWEWKRSDREEPVIIEMTYDLDRWEKTLDLMAGSAATERMIREKYGQTALEDSELIEELLWTEYDYSIEGKQLTLTDREYGNRIVFHKK